MQWIWKSELSDLVRGKVMEGLSNWSRLHFVELSCIKLNVYYDLLALVARPFGFSCTSFLAFLVELHLVAPSCMQLLVVLHLDARRCAYVLHGQTEIMNTMYALYMG